MDTDLMGPARTQPYSKKRQRVKPRQHFPLSKCGSPALCNHCHFLPRARVASNRAVDFTLVGRQLAPDERNIGTGRRVRGELLAQGIVGAQAARHDHEPARILIEAVYDPRPQLAPGRLPARPTVQQAVHERPVPMTGSRMHDQIGRLVDDQDVFILEEHLERNGFGDDLNLAQAGIGGPGDLLPHLDGRAHLAGRAVQENLPIADQLLDRTARDTFGVFSQEKIDADPLALIIDRQAPPLAFGCVRHRPARA